MEQGATNFLNILLRTENLLTMAAAWAIVQTLVKMLPGMEKKAWWARLKVGAPVVWCSIAVWIPGLQPDEMGTGSRIMLGIVLGMATGYMHKLFKQTLLGKDKVIEEAKNGPKPE